MAALLVALLLLIVCSAARAEDGSGSPDGDFFGFWRVIGAERGPWAVARGLKNGEAPLLGWMLEFRDDELRGPRALACKPARYVARQTALSELFDRRLDRDRYVEEGSVLGIMAMAQTEQVVCANAARDFYLTHGGDLLVAVGDLIYRLRRPEGDPRSFAAGDAAPGFDCIAADNAARKVVCLDLNLSRLDRAITVALRRLEAGETAASFATLRAAQQAWFASIVTRCDAGGALPDHADDVAEIRDCLADLYPARQGLFDGLAVAKAGGATLEPRMRFVMKDKPLFTDSDCYPWMTGNGADAFNAYVAGVLAQDDERIDPRGLFVPKNFPPGLALTARRSYRIARFDAHLVSLQIETRDFTGGTHEQRNEFAINWDMTKGRPIGFADLFALDKDGLQFATDFAMTDLKRQFGDGPPPPPDDVAHVVTDPRAWRFAVQGAVVHFPVFSVGNYAQGAFDVAIPYPALKPYLTPGAVALLTQ